MRRQGMEYTCTPSSENLGFGLRARAKIDGGAEDNLLRPPCPSITRDYLRTLAVRQVHCGWLATTPALWGARHTAHFQVWLKPFVSMILGSVAGGTGVSTDEGAITDHFHKHILWSYLLV